MKVVHTPCFEQDPVRVYCGGHCVGHYTSLKTALAHLGPHRFAVSPCGEQVLYGGSEWSSSELLELVSDHGPVPIDAISSTLTELRRRPPSRFAPGDYAFRNGPVPHTGGSRYGRYFRAIRTHNERRADVAFDEQEPRPRLKRNAANIPTSWDDIPRSRKGRNWKNFRRTQWK